MALRLGINCDTVLRTYVRTLQAVSSTYVLAPVDSTHISKLVKNKCRHGVFEWPGAELESNIEVLYSVLRRCT